MEITLKYGHVEESVTVPDTNLLGVAKSPGQLDPPASTEEIIRAALAAPVASPRLRELAAGKSTVAIIVSDHTRPTPSGTLIPYVLEELECAGIKSGQVTVVVATGLHEGPNAEAQERMLGRAVLDRLRVVVHDPDDEANLVDMGVTTSGIPLRVNRVVAEADLVLSFSTIEPHYTYGWSGGAKNIIPGVSWRQTVYNHHGRYHVAPGKINVVENNPAREDAEEAGRMVGLSFILNVLLNAKRELIAAYAGDPVAAHRAGVAHGRRLNVVEIPELADILICALGGSPRDGDFWQAQGKGINHAGHMVRNGGTMILAAGCEYGVGAPAWRDLLLLSMDEIERAHATSNFSVPLAKADDTVRLMRRADLYLVAPGIKPSDLPQLPARFFPTVGEALAAAQAKAGPAAKVLVVPDSSRVVVSLPQ